MKPLIAVYKYGVGNVYSVKAALERAGARAKIVSSLGGSEGYDAIVLPGVGSMPAAMARLRREERLIARLIESGKPLLGICLGMQVLYEASTEHGYTRGMGVLPGVIERLNVKPLPHMGWSIVERIKNSQLLEGLPERFYAYYAHSYASRDVDRMFVKAVTRVGGQVFAALIEKPPVYGTQFHPERSGREGQKIINNFVELAR